jgi:2-polyprenyl-3-methyl-5-hydroxy-6-metoxy-1,4-benzoquinol methylase
MEAQEWTGERLETFIRNETMTEHLHRYAIVLEWIKGKEVLDIACGEGYGANLMADIAAAVTAVDIDAAVIEKARIKYTKRNLSFVSCAATTTPFASQSFDIITCFETIEHLEEQDNLMQELKRLLKPDGLLFISTPDKRIYSGQSGYRNPYHLKELYEKDFTALIEKYFTHSKLYRQLSFTGSLITDNANTAVHRFYQGDYAKIEGEKTLPAPYMILLAGDDKLPLISSSLFQHPDTTSALLEEQEIKLKRTMSYRLGHFILYPAKWLRSLFHK